MIAGRANGPSRVFSAPAIQGGKDRPRTAHDTIAAVSIPALVACEGGVPLNPKCIFCRIGAGEAEASFVLRQDDLVAFLDVAPFVPGHVLVVPRAHHAGLADLPDALGGGMMAAGRRVALAMRRALAPCEGVNFFLADGAAAGQTVFHCHLHVVPRRRGDGFGLRRPPLPTPSRAQLEEQAARLRAACEEEAAPPTAAGGDES